MFTVLWVFIAAAFGIMLFVSISPNIPQELSFLRTTPESVAGFKPVNGWTVIKEGTSVEVRKSFKTPSLVTVGFLCSNTGLAARVQVTFRILAVESVGVSINGANFQGWSRGASKNILPPDAKAFARYVASQQAPVKLHIQAGDKRFDKMVEFDPSGLNAMLAQLPPICQ